MLRGFSHDEEREEKQQKQKAERLITPGDSPFQSVPRTDRMTEEDIEDYLDRLCAPLIGTVSYAQRQQVRDEARRQLESLIAAHQELGAEREEAIARVLRSVPELDLPPLTGEERTIEELDSTSITCAVESLLRRLREPQGMALSSFGLASIVSLLILFGTGNDINFSKGQWLLWFIMVLPPLLAGLFVGRHDAKHPYRRTLGALARLALPMLLAYLFWAHQQRFTYPFDAGRGFATMNAVCWLFFGSLGTVLGTRLRRRPRRSGTARPIRRVRKQRLRAGTVETEATNATLLPNDTNAEAAAVPERCRSFQFRSAGISLLHLLQQATGHFRLPV